MALHMLEKQCKFDGHTQWLKQGLKKLHSSINGAMRSSIEKMHGILETRVVVKPLLPVKFTA